MKPPAPGWSSWCLIFFFRIVPFSDNLLSLSVLAGRARKKAKRRARKKEPTDAEYEFEYVPCPNCETPLEARSWGEKRLRRIEVKTDDSWVLLYIAGECLWTVSIAHCISICRFDCIIFFRRSGATLLYVSCGGRWSEPFRLEKIYDAQGPASVSYVE